MTESQSSPATPQPWRPHEFDHRHGDVSGGWLRAATFGAMDGLVSNTALIAGVGAAADAHTVVISGFAGLVAGAFSMALGEFASVTTANEQIESEVLVEKRAFRLHPQAEKAELVDMLVTMGLYAGDGIQGQRRNPPRREPRAELPSDARARRRSGGEAVALRRGRVQLRHVRHRCDRSADPVSARLPVTVARPAVRRCRSIDRRGSGGAVHQETDMVCVLASVAVRDVAIAATYVVGHLVGTVI